MTFYEKISKILRDNRLPVSTPSALEDYLKIGKAGISSHCSEKTQKKNPSSAPGLKTQKKIVEKLRINPQWWETGNGPIFLDDTSKKEKLRDIDIIEADNYIGMHRRVFDALEKDMNVFRNIINDDKGVIRNLSETIKNLSQKQSEKEGKQISLPRE